MNNQTKGSRELTGMTVSLLIAVVPVAVCHGLMGTLLNDIVGYYGLSGASEGLMSSMSFLGAIIGLLLSLPLRHRLTKVAFAGGFAALAAAAILAQGIPVSFGLFLLFCLLMGMGMGVGDSFQSALMADLHPESAAMHLGIQHAIFGVGNLTIPLVLHAALRVMEFHKVYLLVGAACLLMVAQFLIIAAKNRNKFPALTRYEQPLRLSEISSCFSPAYTFAVIGLLFGAAAQNGITVWVARYMTGTMGLADIAAWGLSLYWIGTTLCRLIMPRLPFSAESELFVGSILGGICWFVGVRIGTGTSVLAGAFLAGLFSGAFMPLILSISARLNPEKTGLATAVLSVLKTIGQMLLPLAIGALNAAIGTTPTMKLVSILFFCTALCGLAIMGTARKGAQKG